MSLPPAINAWVELLNKKRLVEYMLGLGDNPGAPWRQFCEVIPLYLPPFPRPDTRPICVVRYKREAAEWFLRYSKGPRQGFSWDIYGDDLLGAELALIALSAAPPPPIRTFWPPHTGAHEHFKIRCPQCPVMIGGCECPEAGGWRVFTYDVPCGACAEKGAEATR